MVQEKLIFFPQKIDESFRFNFEGKYEEIFIESYDGTMLHGLLFHSNHPAGLIFYLHGNAGSLESWGEVAGNYTDLNYDVFMPDYRGFGKSAGKIKSEGQFYHDVQVAYDEMKQIYNEKNIIVLGYSIGTGPAAKIASENNPELLILQAPYYSLTDLMKHTYRILPSFLLRYKFETYKYVKACKMPVVIFHGDRDEVIYYQSSLKLKKHLKDTDRIIILRGQMHNDMTDHPVYKVEIKNILEKNTRPFN